MREKILIIAICAIFISIPVQAANYPLQILHPRAAGTSPDTNGPAIDANHRIFWAYPGAEYNIRASVIGGLYPYMFSLSNAPNGMIIDEHTGEISWPNPQADAQNVQLTVTDAEGTSQSTTWSVDVDANKFIFLNAAAPEGGSGTFASPYNSISDIPLNTHANKIAYFMTGTYNVLDMPHGTTGNGWDRVEFGTTKPLAWLEYPGQDAVIDFAYHGTSFTPLIRISGPTVYIDGLHALDYYNIGFQMGVSHYGVIRRTEFEGSGPGMDGANSAAVMFLSSYGNPGYYFSIQDNSFHDIGNLNIALKLYSLYKPLLEDNLIYSIPSAGTEGLFAVKSDIIRYTIRANDFYDINNPAIGGNMHHTTDATYGEILYNHIRAGAREAIHLNHDGQSLQTDVYRNTFVGRVEVRGADSSDGPFNIYNNIIVADDPVGGCVPGSRIYCTGLISSSRINSTNNLEGTPSQSIVDQNGDLNQAYSSYLGTHGAQTGPSGPDTAPPVRSSGLPLGTLAPGTTQATISLSTNEAATCRHSASANTAYASMASTFTTTGGTSHSVQATGLSNGQSYAYHVRCQDSLGNTNTNDYVISFSVSVPDNTAPSQVTGLTATATSSSQINLAWSAATDNIGVAGYRIYRDGALMANTTATSHQAAALSPNTTYSFTVSAFDAAGNAGAQSAPSSATTQTQAGSGTIVVELITLTTGDTTAFIEWYTDQYYLVGTLDYGVTATYGSTLVNSGTRRQKSINITGLSPGTSYLYRLTLANNTNSGSITGTFMTTGASNQTLLEGDVTGDRTVNILDIQAILPHFGKSTGYPGNIDLASAGIIDLFDVMVVVRNWGRTQ